MSSSAMFSLQIFLLLALFHQCTCFQTRAFCLKRSFQQLRMAEDENKNIEKREKFGGSAYFQGLITEPIAPTKTTRVDGKERDNLTPNLKFGAILSGVVFGLFELFMFANKDLAPPPY
jgi:hypothetical protein